jgi:hypothetical protein
MRQLNAKKILIAIAFGLVFLNTALAGTTFGVTDCGRWVTESKSTRISAKTWLLGYLTGLGAMHEVNNRNDDPMKKINSSDQIFLWMDNYCQKNPLKDVADGGFQLFMELMKK